MLQSLSIKNVALITSCVIPFGEGLNVMSGETGSGKSVVVDSLNFVLGGKADRGMIKSGEKECSVVAVFTASAEVNGLIRDLGYEADEDGLATVSRRLTAEGKNEIRLNGQPISATVLKKVTGRLVDIHGQSDHFALLKNNLQLKLIDGFNPNVAALLDGLAEPSEKLKEISAAMQKIGGSEEDRLRRLDILRFQIDEIERVAPEEGEEDRLTAERKKLQSAEKIIENLSDATNALSGDGGALDGLRDALRNVARVSGFDEKYEELSVRLAALVSEAEDVGATAEDYASSVDLDEKKLAEVEDRIEELRSLFRKYGGSYDKTMAFLSSAKKEYDALSGAAERLIKLESEKAKYLKQVYNICRRLRKERETAAAAFSSAVMGELNELGMAKSVVEVRFSPFPEEAETEEKLTSNGFDSVEILLSPNPGEPVKPLAKIISGGEMSRFMLAIKARTAEAEGTETCVFDEIDTGISGRIARVVAEKFCTIALFSQLIVISHLPQIAAMADENVLIFKREEGGRTATGVRVLSTEEKVIEVTRLVGGDETEAAAIAHARHMIESSDEFKAKLRG